MRRFVFLVGVLFLAVPAIATAQGVQPAATPRRLAALGQQIGLNVAIHDGRLTATAARESQAAFHHGAEGERISSAMSENGWVIELEYTSPTEKLSFHFQGDDPVNIHHQLPQATAASGEKDPSAGSATPETIVDYSQAARQPIKLTVTENGKTRQVEAATVWHLFLLEPDLVNRHLVPILEMLHPNWQLSSQADQLKKSLLKTAGKVRAADRQRWSELVAQLADDHFAVRQKAERQLRAAGQAVLPYLEALRRSDLDAEQWQRVNEIIDSYDDNHDDTPDRVAERMMEDRSVWLALLDDAQESTRRTAAEQFASIVGQSIEFDPAASAEVCSKQITALRSKYSPHD